MNDRRATIRVAHLLDGRHFGGAEQMVRRLIAASPDAGVEACAYCLNEGRLADFMRADGLRVEVFASSGRFDFRMLGAIARAARSDGIQILQAHTSRTHLLARMLSRRLNIPNITLIQSPIASDENRGTARHPLRARVERWGRCWTNVIVPVSEEETARLAREEGVPSTKLRWIPNGVEDSSRLANPIDTAALRESKWGELGLDPGKFTVAMIAQFRPRKGGEVLLRALGRLKAQGQDAQALLIGDDEFTEGVRYLDQLRALAREIGIESQVCFTGFQAQPWTLAGPAELFVLPSLFGEGLPLVLIEAMNHARPIAVSDTLGNRELVVSGSTGWLHPPGDDAALARDIGSALNNRDHAADMGAAGRERFLARYTLGVVMHQWRVLYDQLVSNSR